MNLKSQLPLLIAGFVLMAFLTAGRAGEPPETVLKRTSSHYLFFLDEYYELSAALTDDKNTDATESQVKPSSFSVSIKAVATGTQDIAEVRFEYQGVRYVVSPHQIVVLGARPKELGVFVETASDPNGSGDVEIALVVNETSKQSNKYVSFDRSKCPEGINVVSQNSGSYFSDGLRQHLMKIVLRNTTGEPFVLKPEMFNNLPAPDHWPTIEIPPVNPRA